MKRIPSLFFSVILFLMPLALHAQGWFENNPQWANHFMLGWGGPGFEYVSVQGDTVVGGQSAIVIKRFRDMQLVSDYTDLRIVRQSGDTIRCWNENDNQFYIHYNFSLGVGDSVVVPTVWGGSSKFKYVIVNTGTVLVDGQSLRFQLVDIPTEISTLKCNALIIEKIGMVSGKCVYSNDNSTYLTGHHFFLDEPNAGVVDGPDWFFCRYQNDQIEYTISGDVCDALTDVDIPGVAGSPFSLAPNPFGDYFSVRVPEGETIASLRLFDVSGRMLKSISVPDGNTVDAADLPSGVYFLEITSARQERSFLRAVRQ